MTCEGKKGRNGNQSKEQRGKKQQEGNLGVLIRCDRCEMHHNPSDVHCQVQELKNYNLIAAGDVTVVSVAVSILSKLSLPF